MARTGIAVRGQRPARSQSSPTRANNSFTKPTNSIL